MVQITPRTTYSRQEDFFQPIVQDIRETGWGIWRKTIKRLVNDYAMEWGAPGKRKRLVMTAGFEWDGASTWLADAIGFKRDGYATAPSMFHDRFYRDGFRLTPGEFEFHVRIGEEWHMDSSAWRRWDADELLGESFFWAGGRRKKGKVMDWVVRLWPPNWLKGG